MKIKLKNFNGIKKASIDLDRITILTGDSKSQKSLIARKLYLQLSNIENIKNENFKLIDIEEIENVGFSYCDNYLYKTKNKEMISSYPKTINIIKRILDGVDEDLLELFIFKSIKKFLLNCSDKNSFFIMLYPESFLEPVKITELSFVILYISLFGRIKFFIVTDYPDIISTVYHQFDKFLSIYNISEKYIIEKENDLEKIFKRFSKCYDLQDSFITWIKNNNL